MKTPPKKHHQLFLTLFLVWVGAIACVFPLGSASQPTQAESSPTAPAAVQLAETSPAAAAKPAEVSPTPAAAPQDELLQPDPLDHLLGLRSIQFNLTVTRPDGSVRSLDGQIDSAGSMHLKFGFTGFDLKGMPGDYNPKALPGSAELYVIDGKAYLPDALDPGWKSTPFDDNYLATLSQELHGLGSPAMWLNILPDGSIQPAGSETVGGFTADKYNVDGSVDGQKISGTIWEEPQADALVQAELHIPAALLSPPDQPLAGEMKITLKAQKAAMAPVTLPPQ